MTIDLTRFIVPNFPPGLGLSDLVVPSPKPLFLITPACSISRLPSETTNFKSEIWTLVLSKGSYCGDDGGDGGSSSSQSRRSDRATTNGIYRKE